MNTDSMVVEKIEEKPKTRRKRTNIKECEVLVYNNIAKTAIISFDGFGFELNNVSEYPGKTIKVKYSGEIHSPKFKVEATNV